MKRLGNLFDTVASTDNLWAAWLEFRRGKRNRPSVRAFEFDVDRELFALGRELHGGSYRPGGYRLRLLHEPKRRLIAAAPVRDRIVHHAVHRLLAPRLDRGLVEHTYACLPGRGSHRALLAFQAAQRRHAYLLHLDVRRYFLSIDRQILHQLMARRIKDRRLLRLLGALAGSGEGLYTSPAVRRALGLEASFPPPGCGLPIGNLTSQWWGNHYLSDLDHFVKRELKIPHAQRYMDDVTLFADSRVDLEAARTAIARWLWRERRLRLKKPNAEVRSTRRRTLYLGHLVDRSQIRPGRRAARSARRRLADHLVRGRMERFERSLASYRGVLLGPVIPGHGADS
ncbi:MAG: RNA-directed DNA polymerase [Thermoanaerobaculia bacterium]